MQNMDAIFSEIVRKELKPLYDLLMGRLNQNPASSAEDEYIDTNEFCKRTGYKPSTVAQKRHKKEIAYHKVGKTILYKSSDVEKFIADSRKESADVLSQQAIQNQRRGGNQK